jgi:hypothetical protein
MNNSPQRQGSRNNKRGSDGENDKKCSPLLHEQEV